MSHRLTEQEIAQRLIKLRNYEQLYPKLQEKCRLLEEQNRLLMTRAKQQDELLSLQAKQIEQLSHTVEELKRIIFGRKKQPSKDLTADANDSSSNTNASKQPRPASSYRRPVPSADTITETVSYDLSCCPNCGSPLTRLKQIVRYLEDLLPLSEWKQALKRVTRMLIATGYCGHCKKRVTASNIPQQTVSLGEQIKSFAAFASVILRLSYGQVNDFLQTVAGITVSGGELDNILRNQADKLRPEWEQIKIRLNDEQSSHYDETSWPVQGKNGQGNYAWVRASGITQEALFLLGRNRGKGNLDNLKGPPEQIGVSDDYGSYKTAFNIHALCWSHPHRKFRDLTEAGYLTDKQREQAVVTHKAFAALYEKVRAVCMAEFNLGQRLKLLPELETGFENIFQPHPDDPQKLVTLKESLQKNQPCYFVCVTTRGVSPDNNKAERTLRHLVLKRKNSYGSKSQKGADTSSILYSVLLSLWRTSKDKFFTEYQRLLERTQELQTATPKPA